MHKNTASRKIIFFVLFITPVYITREPATE